MQNKRCEMGTGGMENEDDEEVEWWGKTRGSRGGDEERIEASWVSIRWLEAAREDSSGSQEGDWLHGRVCIPLASQKQYWSQWKAHTARLREGGQALQEAYGSHFHLLVFIRLGFICHLVAPLPLLEQRLSIALLP